MNCTVPKSLPNFRDLGGLPCEDGRVIRPGKLYRTPALRPKGLSRRERAKTLAFIDALKLDTVLDFRSRAEYKEKPDYCPPGVRHLEVPFFADGQVDRIIVTRRSVARMLTLRGNRIPLLVEEKWESYRVMPFSNGKVALTALFEAMDRGDTIAFHCTEGKDRTGFAAYVLERCLGRSDEAARVEYLKSNGPMEQQIARQERFFRLIRMPKELMEAMNYVEHCHEELLDLSLAAIHEKYDSLEAYLEAEFGVTGARMEKWRNDYCE